MGMWKYLISSEIAVIYVYIYVYMMIMMIMMMMMMMTMMTTMMMMMMVMMTEVVNNHRFINLRPFGDINHYFVVIYM